jgi:hypothetical protein
LANDPDLEHATVERFGPGERDFYIPDEYGLMRGVRPDGTRDDYILLRTRHVESGESVDVVFDAAAIQRLHQMRMLYESGEVKFSDYLPEEPDKPPEERRVR